MKRKMIVGGLIAALALPAVAIAAKDGGHGGGPKHGKMFERLDTNKDGEISLEEMNASMSDRFGKLDADGSGTITIEEMSVKRQEFFNKLDADNSGTISKEEAKAARELRREMKQERRAARIMDRFDTDKDGKISREEYQAVVMERFDNADTDNSGFITIEQVQNLSGKMKKKGG